MHIYVTFLFYGIADSYLFTFSITTSDRLGNKIFRQMISVNDVVVTTGKKSSEKGVSLASLTTDERRELSNGIRRKENDSSDDLHEDCVRALDGEL